MKHDGSCEELKMDDTVMTAVGLSDIPESIRAHDTLASPDYVDVFTVPASGVTDRSPEEWARAVLEETPAGRLAPALWRRLGLRLGPTPSAEHVQGLKIAACLVRPLRPPDRLPCLDAGVRHASPSGARHAPPGSDLAARPPER
jgi:hypothetical protein